MSEAAEPMQSGQDDCRNVDSGLGATVHVNRLRTDWRGRVGHLLRYWAQRIDGRLTLAVEFQTTHPIGPIRQKFCLDRGMACVADHALVATQEVAKWSRTHHESAN